ncbi:UNVERIFIED_ORG: hemagglutinin-like protein [Herbaspirillum seropedicae]
MTQVRAGGQVNIDSGRDTNLIGATVSGDKVVADVGRDLNIASVQDTSTFKSRDQSIGGSATIGYGSGASVNASRSRVDADYASVGQQAGIMAGDGGFQINVKGNTDLKGAQIASTDKAVEEGKNSLTTGTLTSSDIQNRSQYSAESQSVSAGTSGGKPGGGAGIGNASGSETSVTRSGVSGGAVKITDAQAQQAKTGQSPDQVVASLDTSVRTGKDSSNSLAKNWNGNELREDVEAQAKITQAFGQQAAKMVGSYADAKEKELRQAASTAAQNGDQTQADQLSAEADQWKEGGAYRAGAHSAIGLLAGGVSGVLGAAASSALMPDIAEQIKKLGLPAEVESAVSLAAAAGVGAAVGGGAGAASAFNVDLNNRQLHEDKIAKEKTLAKQLAEKSAGRYTVEEIEDALRVAENKALGEDVLKGAVIKLDGKTTAADLSDVKGMVLVTDSQGNRYLVQTGLQKFPSRELQEFISSNTGSTYSWATPQSATSSTIEKVSPYAPGWNTGEYAAGIALNSNVGRSGTLSVGVSGSYTFGFGGSGQTGVFFNPGINGSKFGFGLYGSVGAAFGFDPGASLSLGYTKGDVVENFSGSAKSVNMGFNPLPDIGGQFSTVLNDNNQVVGGAISVGIKGTPSLVGPTFSVSKPTTYIYGWIDGKPVVGAAP